MAIYREVSTIVVSDEAVVLMYRVSKHMSELV